MPKNILIKSFFQLLNLFLFYTNTIFTLTYPFIQIILDMEVIKFIHVK